MNQLSWLIYFADITSTLGGWMIFFAVVTFILSAIFTIWWMDSIDKPADEKPPKVAWMLYPIFIFFMVTSIMIPSRDTVLAIAASEMGEKVLATPQAQRVGEALTKWIENQTAEPVDDHK